MKKLMTLPLFCLLGACVTTVPVTAKFPDVPPVLRQPCPQLGTLKKDDPKLSDMMTAVANNYVKYHECAAQVDSWNEWYTSQKKIFENATK